MAAQSGEKLSWAQKEITKQALETKEQPAAATQRRGQNFVVGVYIEGGRKNARKEVWAGREEDAP